MKINYQGLTAIILGAIIVTTSGCASVSMADKTASDAKKTFAAPSEGKAGVYIFRDSVIGAALKKDIWIDGQCVGESAPNVFFHTEVEGNKQHTLITESQFSPNQLEIFFEAGKNYFVRQYIKLGVLVGGANFEQVDEAQGKAAVAKLDLAQSGKCSAPSKTSAAK